MDQNMSVVDNNDHYHGGWDSEGDFDYENYMSLASSAIVGEASTSAGPSNTKVFDHFVNMGFSPKNVAEAIQKHGEQNEESILEDLLAYNASTSAGPSNTKVFDHFVNMGFSPKNVAEAIQKHGEQNEESILEDLSYNSLESSPDQNSPEQKRSPPEQCALPEQEQIDSDSFSSDSEGSSLHDFSDYDSFDDQASTSPIPKSEAEMILASLKDMGYADFEAFTALERCGVGASIDELTDFISAAQLSRAEDANYPLEEKPRYFSIKEKKKRKLCDLASLKRKRKVRITGEDDDDALHLPNPMIGFGTPTDDCQIHRSLPMGANGPPYFYYENVALTPKGVWNIISRFLYDVEPEFVDSKHFCAAARKRGYVHNLPIENRFPLVPLQPQTIFEAFPLASRWWPSWDNRTQFNCLQTSIASAKLTGRIQKWLEGYGEDEIPPIEVRNRVLYQCRKWNLVWVGKNKVAPLEPHEVEKLLGFPMDHTRGITRTDRYKSLGNSFQIDTVAYHLSVLKERFPNGMNVLSLFSGIGGAEIALYKLGIKMKNVVSVELSEVSRNVVRTWWDQTRQRGNLIHLADVQELDADRLAEYMKMFGGFDLVIGGSPCNNLAGSNRHHRVGLEGKESSLFYDYFRILDLVKVMMQ